jgi:hypothetical protein
VNGKWYMLLTFKTDFSVLATPLPQVPKLSTCDLGLLFHCCPWQYAKSQTSCFRRSVWDNSSLFFFFLLLWSCSTIHRLNQSHAESFQMQSSCTIMWYDFFTGFWHLGRFNCLCWCSVPNQDWAAEFHPCCAQQSLLEGWGEECLLSCYPVYIIHYLLTTSTATCKSCGYNIWKG